VPGRIREQLKIQFENNTIRSMANAANLRKVSQLLTENKISFLAFKGPTLALYLYGNVNMRHAGDLDLLIDLFEVETAEAVLQRAGYRRSEPDFELSPKQQNVYQAVCHHFIYQMPGESLAIELHWRLTHNRLLLPTTFEQLLHQSRIQMVGGFPVPTLSHRDMAPYLFAHGAYHAWYRLSWLYNLVTFIE